MAEIFASGEVSLDLCCEFLARWTPKQTEPLPHAGLLVERPELTAPRGTASLAGVSLRAELPYAGRTVIALEPAHFAVLERTVRLVFQLAHGAAYRERIDGEAPATLRFEPGD